MTLPFNATRVLNDGFVGLADHMGDDSAIVQAARISYGKDNRTDGHELYKKGDNYIPDAIKDSNGDIVLGMCKKCGAAEVELDRYPCTNELPKADRQLIRYLMRHRHTTPFEMVEFKFIVRVPMDCWRQWIRHRTASVNEYSTRYTEAIDSCQTTAPDEWRLQATNNKQGSSGYLDEWPKSVVKHDGTEFGDASYYLETDYENEEVNIDEYNSPGEYLSAREKHLQNEIQRVYKERITLGIAKEQARKDLPLSTYTEAYWKINLHNLLHFLSLRMDSHAQYEIRTYANAIYQLIKPIVPVACEAFEDYRLNACTFSAQEMELIRKLVSDHHSTYNGTKYDISFNKPSSLSEREWKELKEKLCI